MAAGAVMAAAWEINPPDSKPAPKPIPSEVFRTGSIGRLPDDEADAMRALIGLTEALEDEVPFIYDVKTLANAELTIGTEDGININKIKNDWPLTQAELLERRDAFLEKPMLVGGIINKSADFAAIIFCPLKKPKPAKK